ncbi:MAG TPA: MotA/TolQ/ExbB proton channel family protein [Hyphomicrobiales bacterium]|nr:MotA/TolQ/ExbB proton channel family protein [Hyphomicrobiales bacterium]
MTDELVAEELSKFFDLIGPVGMVLVALLVLSLLIILSKLFMFGQRRLTRTRSANEYLRRIGENDREAIEVLENSSAPLARLLLVGARLAQTEAPMIRIEADMRDAATSYLQRLSRMNRTLELIGIIAPLLGLLGTVFGIIDAFQVLQASGAQADPAALAGGIWEALTTTALGIIVAIPAIVAFNLSEARIEKFRQLVSAIFGRFLAAVEASRGKL